MSNAQKANYTAQTMLNLYKVMENVKIVWTITIILVWIVQLFNQKFGIAARFEKGRFFIMKNTKFDKFIHEKVAFNLIMHNLLPYDSIKIYIWLQIFNFRSLIHMF
jgi:hypothetical protein